MNLTHVDKTPPRHLARLDQHHAQGGPMQPVNMLEAKSTLSRLVEAVESGREQEIVLARNGRPVARIVAINAQPRDAINKSPKAA